MATEHERFERLVRAAVRSMAAGRMVPHCGKPATEREIEWINWSEGYAEPGYTDTPRGVLTGNWNGYPKKLCTVLEKRGYALEWEDEWINCSGCGRLFRSSADSYSWQMAGCITEDGEAYCTECTDPADHLRSLEDNPRVCNMIASIDPSEHGYERYNGTYENGFHPGQTDDPKKIYDDMRAKGYTRILFNMDRVQQFDCRFSAWYVPSEETTEDA